MRGVRAGLGRSRRCAPPRYGESSTIRRMKGTTLTILLLVLSTAVATVLGQAPQARATAITHARLLDVKTGAIQADITIVVRGRTIASVGTSAPPAGATIIDAR